MALSGVYRLNVMAGKGKEIHEHITYLYKNNSLFFSCSTINVTYQLHKLPS
jgi:hypothetical protein